jgi:hypothetical protein
MGEEQPDNRQIEYNSEDLVNPLDWLKRQPYGKLKYWLRQGMWNGKFLPVMIPYNIPPVSYLSQLLLRSDTEVKTSLRTIVPELLREWNAYDDAECLLNLLILSSNLSCNEAETIIATIITEKLGETPEHIECRREGLGVLQSIGTERTIHLYKRYIGNPEYAAFCYRGLYLFDLTNAATELPALMDLCRPGESEQNLKGILHLLFMATIKQPQHITVVQAFVENAPAEYFVEFFDLLRSLDVLNQSFFNNLSKAENVKLLSQLIKRTPLEDSSKIVALLQAVGIEIEPPADSYNPEPEIPKPAMPLDVIPLPGVSIGGGRYFTYRAAAGMGESVPVLAMEEINGQRQWAFSRNYNPRELDHWFQIH